MRSNIFPYAGIVLGLKFKRFCRENIDRHIWIIITDEVENFHVSIFRPIQSAFHFREIQKRYGNERFIAKTVKRGQRPR